MKERKENVIYNKAFQFALEIIRLYKTLNKEKREFVLSKQLLKSGTSIGANIRETLEAQSRKDFICKLSIALKEAGETEYWLELLKETDYLIIEEFDYLASKLSEIIKILNSILKTTRKTLTQNQNEHLTKDYEAKPRN